MKKLILFCLITVFLSVKAEYKTIRTSDGVDLYVEVKGNGIPCLYIHGGPGSGSYWLEVLYGNVLEKYFKMVYLDQRGVSRSSSPKDSNYSMERMVKDFEEVRKSLGIKQWLILGHSFGGILQVGYVKEHHEVIKGMMMINCSLSLKDGLSESWIPKACEFLNIDNTTYLNDDTPLNERMQKLVTMLQEKDLFWKMGYSSKKSIEIMNNTFNDIPNWNHDFENLALNNPEYSMDFRKYAPEINVPVLFFYGKTDYMVGPEYYKGVHFPHMLLWGSNVGHVPFIENKDDLEKAIKTYLDNYKIM
jgi:proline iminopeptidase